MKQAIRALYRTFGLALAMWVVCIPLPALGADHGDPPALTMAGRQDAMTTDFHVFTRGENLVLSVCMNPAIPVSADTYQFASDLTVRINIDNHSAVSFSDANDMAVYGGTVVSPGGILEDIVFEVTFNALGTPLLSMTGLSPLAQGRVDMFTGLRDDPFIRGNRAGRNVAGVVIEIPVADVLADQSTILAWAVTSVPDLSGPFQELAGRALRSMFPENHLMNSIPPSEHTLQMNVPPDIVIFDTSRPAQFPNGRELADDVVDLVGDVRVTSTDAPFPSANDVPFLNEFPYLAPPHHAGPLAIPTVGEWGLAALTLVLLIGAKITFADRARPARVQA